MKKSIFKENMPKKKIKLMSEDGKSIEAQNVMYFINFLQ